MSYIPTPEQAMELTQKYNKEPFHIQHAQTVGKVLAYIARENDPGKEDYWNAVGILHDVDFEQWPEQHCIKAQELLRGGATVTEACEGSGFNNYSHFIRTFSKVTGLSPKQYVKSQKNE